MNDQHSLSPGLLVFTPPESFHALHLDDGGKGDDFDWESVESDSFFRLTLDYLKSMLQKP